MRRSLVAMITFCAFAAAAVPAQEANPFEARARAVTDRPEFRHAIWGIAVVDLATGQPLYARNSDQLFIAASTTKLLTEGTALALLGRDRRFETRVYRTGEVSRSGVLRGDLVLVASGDPNLSARVRPDDTLAFEDEDHSYGGSPDTRAVPGDPLLVVRELADAIAAKGIRRVRGRILVDDTLFAGGDRELGTGVVISPIVVNDNLIDVTVAPGAQVGAPVKLDTSPPTAYVRVINRAKTGAASSKDDVHPEQEVQRPDGGYDVTVAGSFPIDKPATLGSYPVPSPADFARILLIEALASRGVRVTPKRHSPPADFATLAKLYTAERLVAEHLSPPFREEAKVTLKVSQNLHASLTPRLVGALLRKDKEQTGFDLEREFLASLGLDLGGAQQADGAGGDARFSPAFMTGYLVAMSKRPESADFRAALPVLGRDGTLHDIQPQSPAAGKVSAKTGTFTLDDPLNRRTLVTAKALAGYATTASGRNVAFALFVNNVAVDDKPGETKRVAGQALGEVAAAIWESF
jgi:D-alanyl-D-alanine carboxypeptidase/D-alanyl-D-alanine-endopeptidase (penicillin-binding protein 4)